MKEEDKNIELDKVVVLPNGPYDGKKISDFSNISKFFQTEAYSELNKILMINPNLLNEALKKGITYDDSKDIEREKELQRYFDEKHKKECEEAYRFGYESTSKNGPRTSVPVWIKDFYDEEGQEYYYRGRSDGIKEYNRMNNGRVTVSESELIASFMKLGMSYEEVNKMLSETKRKNLSEIEELVKTDDAIQLNDVNESEKKR